ncbi:ABC transporter substrate-binding protein [Tropicimonas isoalkanivorans]|uniref:Putative spermidine/putrescine transport system substrate-binding protein n=1 Tax=Tropicimonas isoalkanivorans TaxID=441112 RepID=A0A1I1HU95_9RHOB|nr:ABC transporter substrate-binding protein [Tropicimonas isoalkanivorans]SFC25518.1 putative spermidine/putrescine transport system substrate-binding protein [Tropicimonas isoalkanivorans]
MTQNRSGFTRRGFLKASAATLPAAAMISRGHMARAQSNQVIIRTSSGGSYGDAMERAVYGPFTEATGIQVVKTPSDMAPLIQSVKNEQPLVDVVDTSEGLLQTLAANDVLEPVDYNRFTMFSVDDIGADSAQELMVRRMVYARVLGYSTKAFADGAPTSWAEFWDVEQFPGARAISGLDLNMPDLEFALLADGVPMDELYPLDIDRALAAFSRIRDDIVSFYDTDAISANLLSTGEVDIEAIANGRIQPMIDEGGDYAIEWNEHMKMPSAYAILKNPVNLENAHKFIDFALSPETQARFVEEIPYGPTNQKAFELIAPEMAAKLPTNPEWNDKGFTQNVAWWGENAEAVTQAWNTWAAQ